MKSRGGVGGRSPPTVRSRRERGFVRGTDIALQLALFSWIGMLVLLHWTVPGPGWLIATLAVGAIGGLAAMIVGFVLGAVTGGSLDPPGCYFVLLSPASIVAGAWWGSEWALARGLEPPAARLAGMGTAFVALVLATLLLAAGKLVVERLRGEAPP